MNSNEKGVVNEPKGQHLLGDAIGFHGQKIFCLHQAKVSSLDVPQGPNMQRALTSSDMQGAYRVACLGATDEEWKILAMAALHANELDIARNAFARLKDSKFLDLIDEIERSGSGKGVAIVPEKAERRGRNAALSTGPKVEVKAPLSVAWKAESLAYEGHHIEAAKMYAKNGQHSDAVRLLADLRLYDEAKSYAHSGSVDISHLNLEQAKWLEDTRDSKGAAKLFLSMNENMQAAKVLAEAKHDGWVQSLLDVVQVCMKDEKDVLLFCGDVFSQANCDNEAKETYLKLGDLSKLMEFYTKREMWTEAAQLAEEYDGAFDSGMFLPYAEWLLDQDRYEDAMKAYKKAGRRDLARKVLEQLTMNAVVESRFKDAAYYYWLLSKENDGGDQKAQCESEHKADLYFAYASVHSFVTDPFTSQEPEMLFQVSRFIINSLGNSNSIPHGISKASTLFTLGRQAMALGAFKLARHTFDRLGKLQLPYKKQQEIEHDMLIVQAKPVRDDPSHSPVCYRCGSTNPLLNPFTNKFAKGDVCTNCGHPFVRSFISFDILPLVEFVPNPSISDEEAIDLIRQSPGEGGRSGKSSGWNEGKVGESDTMTFDGPSNFDHDDFGGPGSADLFTRNLNAVLESQGTAQSYIPVTLDANALASIKRSDVFVCRPSSNEKRATFYKNMLPEIAIAISQPCHRFFHLEDFEFSYLSNKSCPYSRLKNVGEYGSL
jgi:intraflagellar transport protein 122